MKKLTYEFIKSEFEKEGYTLVSKEYIDSKTKLDYKCSKGHEYSIKYNGWKNGNRCIICSGLLKLTIEQVRNSFEDEGYTLLSKKYVNNHTKLNYQCSNGHKHSITWHDWDYGYRCPFCYGNIKLTLEQVKESLKSENYILLSNEYINNNTKLDCKCSEGHEYSITWNNWNKGARCSTCKNIKFSGAGHQRWKGGISFEIYCSIWKDKEYKQSIRERDDNKCLNPYCCSNKPNDLAIHHIDYNKKNCNPYNLITVCRSCNFKANTDREWHTAWYQALIYKRYLENKHAN
jgi:hypothetical protein